MVGGSEGHSPQLIELKSALFNTVWARPVPPHPDPECSFTYQSCLWGSECLKLRGVRPLGAPG